MVKAFSKSVLHKRIIEVEMSREEVGLGPACPAPPAPEGWDKDVTDNNMNTSPLFNTNEVILSSSHSS